MIKVLQLISLFTLLSIVNGVSAQDSDSIQIKPKKDRFVFSCQRALNAKGEWKSGSNCRGPSGDIIESVVFPHDSNVEIIVDKNIKK